MEITTDRPGFPALPRLFRGVTEDPLLPWIGSRCREHRLEQCRERLASPSLRSSATGGTLVMLTRRLRGGNSGSTGERRVPQTGEVVHEHAWGNTGGGSVCLPTLPGREIVDDASDVVRDVAVEIDAPGHVEMHAVEAHHCRLTLYRHGPGVAPSRTIEDRPRIKERDPVIPGGLLGTDLLDHLHIGRQLGVLHCRLSDPEHLGAFARRARP